MKVDSVSDVEDHIRTTALTKRIRISEFFLDFDKLRSGYVTETQFFRVLWENLGVILTDEQQKLIISKYDNLRQGRLNYRFFCEVINQPFQPNDLSRDPTLQSIEAVELLGTKRSLRPLSAASEVHIEKLLRSLATYYKHRGLNLRTCCEDFDRHHIGVIQESQFYRSFPRPPEVTNEDIALLVQKYQDPERAGLLNYLNLHHDLVAIGDKLQAEESMSVNLGPNVCSYLPPQSADDQTLDYIFEKIIVAVYKNGVRTPEFFRDYDKLRSGIITDNQFNCGLSLAIGKEAQLTRSEIQKVVEYYRISDGRVRYKEFCDMMENAFNIPDLEKKPTVDAGCVRPVQGALGRTLHPVTAPEDARLLQVLTELSNVVRKRRLMMYQYFKDYDRGRGYTRVVTPTQFGRILHFLTLNVAPEDFKLLCRKFADPATGDINYPAFVQAVDQEFVGYSMESPSAAEEKKVEETQPTAPPSCADVNMDDLMTRIRHHVLTNRLRVCEYFQDFDPLRSGCITKSQFRRGLSDLGLSALGQHNLSEPQFQALCNFYSSPDMPDKVRWTEFMWHIETVFTQPNLEKCPTHQVPPQELFRVPKPGSMKWEYASGDHTQFYTEIMERLKQRANQRRVLAKPVFQDFDKHNNGHVTRSQFRQCLTMLELHCTEPEMQALEAKFCNDTGFHYIAFLKELQPEEPATFMYLERLKELRKVNLGKKLPDPGVDTDLESVLTKIKTKVCKERMRVLEFMRDYDKLRTGRMPSANFRRALDLCTFNLAECEVAVLEDRYKSVGYPGFIEYLQFSDDIESIFTTKNLEKTPLLDPEQFKPPEEWQLNVMAPEAEEIYQKCIARLAEKVRKTRMQLFPLFEDYDRVHNGTVSRSQFRRVLNELELASIVATEQDWVCLQKKFEVKIGGKDDVNYIAFCDILYDLARFEWRKP